MLIAHSHQFAGSTEKHVEDPSQFAIAQSVVAAAEVLDATHRHLVPHSGLDVNYILPIATLGRCGALFI